MGWFKFIVFGMAASVLVPVAAAAQDGARLPDIPQFTPSLTLNENPEICAAFQSAWTDVYHGEGGLNEASVDLSAAFPDAAHIYPAEREPATRGFYGTTIDIKLDYDGDGDNEVLYLESNDVGWRYLGLGIYLYDSREDFDAEAIKDGEGRMSNPRLRFHMGDTENSKAQRLALYRGLSAASLFQIGGKLYSQSNVETDTGVPVRASLDWLRPGEDPAPICEINLNPPAETLLEAGQTIETFQHLTDVYGGPEEGGMCYGTMGWRASPVAAHLPDLFYRPQAMRDTYGQAVDMSHAADTAREFRFAAWGIKDPTSYAVVEALKADYPTFTADFARYYQRFFGMSEDDAKQAAERGYRYLQDRVFYARNSGPQFSRNVFEGISVGPETPLPETATLATQKAVTDELGDVDVLTFGLMAGVDTETLLALSALALSDDNPRYERAEPKDKARMINALFLASQKQPDMMQHFLDMGADADAPTNYFGKTALMYAAQNNDGNAAAALLGKGADPNSRTESAGRSCQRPLTYDARTPLMYAAENAGAAMIQTLLDAGAETTAKDSKGNSTLWYLEKNTRLSEAEKILMRDKFTPQK